MPDNRNLKKMDKYSAAKVLTEELVKYNGQRAISDQLYMKKLLDESEHAYAISNPIAFSESCYAYNSPRHKVFSLTNKDVFSSLEEFIKGHVPEEANYLFVHDYQSLGDGSLAKCEMTPYSIISSREVEDIKRLFYKNYDLGIREAISSLGIKDYFQIYQAYSKNNENFFRDLVEFPNFCKKTIKLLDSFEYDKDDEVNKNEFKKINGFDNLNLTLKRFNFDYELPPIGDTTWVKRQDIRNLSSFLQGQMCKKEYNISEGLAFEFSKFAFEMPYEDQNIESNKIILSEYPSIVDVDIIMLKEFNGKHFKEYFEVLGEQDQKKIVRMIKNSDMENTVINSFLWSKGFKDVSLNYMEIYKGNKGNSAGFIEYLKSKKPEEKRVIIKDIMACDYTNQEVADWLEDNEAELLREASFLED